MSTAFVLSGGASLGSVQVGRLLALAEHQITPDLVVGTSVGAVNAAWIAGRPGRLGFLGRSDHLVPADPLRSLMRQHLNYARLEETAVPVQVVVHRDITAWRSCLGRGDAVDAVAIPGVFPPVTVQGHQLMDGGVSNNTPIFHAIDAGATTVYVLPTGCACSMPSAPKGALAMALQSITLLVQQRLITDVARYEGKDRPEAHPAGVLNLRRGSDGARLAHPEARR